MNQFYKGQPVREKATGKRWWVTATYPRSVTAQRTRLQNSMEPWGGIERVFKREEIAEDEKR